MSPSHTIAAIATPVGTGALSLIRLSGPDAVDIASKAIGTDLTLQPSHTAKYLRVRDRDGQVIDDGILSVFRAPASATGEDCVEFSGHGGMLVTRKLLARFLECGAQSAEPGEFTRRAYLNGKLDLTQAEAVMDLIAAQTDLSLRAARSQMEGHLGSKTESLRNDLLEALAHLEAWIDFPDEDISPETGKLLANRVWQVRQEVLQLLSTADQGRILREGILTVIHGAPNVGKSSLLNHLLGYERAIVSEQAGTTRDTIEETINYHGIPLRLVDTAGVRETVDDLEQQGIDRAMRQMQSADLILHLLDSSSPAADQMRSCDGEPRKIIRILNKSDRTPHPSWEGFEAIRISCLSGEGMDDLKKAVMDFTHLDPTDHGQASIAINARHKRSLEQAADTLEAALRNLSTDAWNAELASIDLREALDALGEIPGKVDTEDLLGVIFSRFCIGK